RRRPAPRPPTRRPRHGSPWSSPRSQARPRVLEVALDAALVRARVADLEGVDEAAVPGDERRGTARVPSDAVRDHALLAFAQAHEERAEQSVAARGDDLVVEARVERRVLGDVAV